MRGKDRTITTTLQIFAGLVLLAATLFFVTPSWLQNLEYLQGQQVHYSSVGVFTAEEFLGYLADNEVDIDYYDILESGNVEIGYDFYAPSGIEGLSVVPYDTWDMPIAYNFRGTGLSLLYMLITILLFLFVLMVVYSIQGVRVGNRKIDALFDRTRHVAFRIYDGFTRGSRADIQFAEKVDLDVGGARGIIAIRTWSFLRGSKLRSTAKGTKWENKTLIADVMPTAENDSGIYALCIGASNAKMALGLVFGLVEMTGKFEYHGDGLVRAEKCEMKLLVCSDSMPNRAKRLSELYDVPVHLAEDPIVVYHSWLYGQNGLECLQHNQQIIGKGG